MADADGPSSTAMDVVRRLLQRPVPRREDFFGAEGHMNDSRLANSCSSCDGDGHRAASSPAPDERPAANSPAPNSSPLESLPPDASSHLLSFLYPHELYHFALVSHRASQMFHTDDLWRIKFGLRWNCRPDRRHAVRNTPGRAGGEGGGDGIGEGSGESTTTATTASGRSRQDGYWKRCYVNAHRNPHDLWVRHWNCVPPEDVTTSHGRTVVPDEQFDDGDGEDWRRRRMQRRRGSDDGVEDGGRGQRSRLDSPSMEVCPTCRYHPALHPDGYEDVLDAMDSEMEFARQRSHSQAALHVGEELGHDSDATKFCDPVQRAEVAAAAHALLANSPNHAHGTYNGLGSSSAKAIHHAMRYSLAKWCRNMNASQLLDQCHEDMLAKKHHNKDGGTERPSAEERAKLAFECAATHDRRIETDQYRSSGMHFLADALFFNLRPSYEKRQTSSSCLRSRLAGGDKSRTNSPVDELERDVGQASRLGPHFETSQHTWHVVRLTNPDFVLSIAFRAYVQSDNFTIYPAEGHLRPGETTHIYLGVRAKGAVINERFEQFDVEKDGAGSGLDGGEDHLPLVPFAIRYMFAPPVGCVPHEYAARPDTHARSLFAPAMLPQSEAVRLPAVADQLWENVTSEADVRTIFLSAHVHANYGLEEFQHATLMPFDVAVDPSGECGAPLTTVMPQLQRKDPRLFSLMQNLDEEMDDSDAGDLRRTERGCVLCKRDWGPQNELLGRSYILRRLECLRHDMIQARRMDDFERSLGAVPSLLGRSLSASDVSIPRINRICQLLFCLHTEYLLQRRADRLVATEERALCSAYEAYIEETYADLQSLLPSANGKMRNADGRWRLTWNSRENDPIVWREKGVEPTNAKSCDGFIGRQDDPNHQDGSQRRPSMHTDMFQNDPLKGLVCAWNMISNPELLVGHGVYDRVKAPGGIIRCPSQPIDVFFRPPKSERDRQQLIRDAVALLQEIASNEKMAGSKRRRNHSRHWFKRINFEMNEQDPDGLDLITLGSSVQLNFQTSMAHYLSNVPMPGQGLFPLSSPKGDGDGYDSSIVALFSTVQPYSHLLYPAMERGGDGEHRADQNQEPNIHNPRNEQNDGGQGFNPLELNIVWLIARHLGFVVDDEDNRGSLLVDRRLLIATQWLSNTILVFSLLASLLSRKFQLITSFPVAVDVHVGFWQDVYMNIPRKSIDVAGRKIGPSRFWTNEECGVAAIIVFVLYFVLGRMYERQIGRSYERELTEASPDPAPVGIRVGLFGNIRHQLCLRMQLLWDNTCPLFVQRTLLMSTRSKQSREEVINQVVHLRSKNESLQSTFNASDGRCRMPVAIPSRELGVCGHLIGLAFFFISFSACSPHFVVNSLTVFCCGLSYGMSLSLESMEIVRRTTSSGVLSMIKPRRLNTLVIGFVTIGQLVGSSGGIVFLAEFIVTAISLLLGGAAAVTSHALESWITFFCLSSTAFWGFVFARLGLLDGMRKKRRGIPSALLCASLCTAITMWVVVLTRVDWYSLSPGSLIVAQAREVVSGLRRGRI